MLLAAYSHPRANREIVLGDARIAYEFRRATRRSIGFVIRPEGLVVSAPKWVPLAEVDAAVRDKARWIIEKLGETHERQQRRVSAQIDWKEGVTLPYLGGTLTVLLNPRLAINRAAAELHTDGGAHTLFLPLLSSATPNQIRDATQIWLTRRGYQPTTRGGWQCAMAFRPRGSSLQATDHCLRR